MLEHSRGVANLSEQADMTNRTCNVDGCERVEQLRRGMCQKHYLRWKQHGNTDDPKPVTHCQRGHELTPENTLTRSGKRQCRECVNAAKRAAYAAAEAAKCSVADCPTTARKRSWCQSHYERWKEHGDPLAGAPIQRAAASPEERLTRQRQAGARYRAANREKELARYNRYRQQNWETVKASLYRWRQENSGSWHAIVYRARLRRLERIGPDPERVDRNAILAAFGMVCHICGAAIASRDDLEFDHVVPIARGGKETFDNIRPAHMVCNRRKGAKILT